MYRKKTNSDIYIHWDTEAPTQWKMSTLKGLVKRAFKVCSNAQKLDEELNHLRRVFNELNGYPVWFIDNVIKEVESKQGNLARPEQEGMDDQDQIKIFLNLPYKGKAGQRLLRKLKRLVNNNTPPNVQSCFTYNSKKLASRFQIKDKTKNEHKYDVVYKAV